MSRRGCTECPVQFFSLWNILKYGEAIGQEFNIISPLFNNTEFGSNIQAKSIECILEWNLENPSVWIFSVPFSLKGSSKCTNHVNVHKLYAVEYINTVCSINWKNYYEHWVWTADLFL